MKIHKIMLMVLACAAVISLGTLTAKAEQGSSNPFKARVEAQAEKNKDIRNEKVDDLRGLKASTTNMIKGLKGEFKDDRKEARDEFKNEREDCKGLSASSTTGILKRDCLEDRKDDRKEFRASTTEMFKRFKDDRKEIMQKMLKDSFEIRKNALVLHLKSALDNLLNIRTRINERIAKLDTEGKNTTEAKAKLAIADDKFAKARVSVDALAAFTATSTVAQASTTAEVDLVKPRQIGDAAIKAVKEVRDALKEVIQEIVKIVGKGRFMNATTTASTTTSI